MRRFLLFFIFSLFLLFAFCTKTFAVTQGSDAGGGGSSVTNPYPSVKCDDKNALYCLSNQPCEGTGCQVFNCHEKDNVWGCIDASSSCQTTNLTQDDRCLYTQACNSADTDCKVFNCNKRDKLDVGKLDGDFQDHSEYKFFCVPKADVEPAPTEPNPPNFNKPCAKGYDENKQLTTNPDDIKHCSVIQTALGDIEVGPAELIRSVFGIILSIAGGIALILIIYSGFQLIASQGVPEKLEAARQQLVSAIVGLLFIIFALVILQIIGVNILRIPGFSGNDPTPASNAPAPQLPAGSQKQLFQ